jgi:hypothetical protein
MTNSINEFGLTLAELTEAMKEWIPKQPTGGPFFGVDRSKKLERTIAENEQRYEYLLNESEKNVIEKMRASTR